MDNPETDKNIIQCKVKKISEADNYGFGILFCVDNSDSNNVSFYRLFITVNGIFTVQKMSDGKWLDPPSIRWRNSSDLKTGNFVIDKSGSMSDSDKMEWVKDSFRVFADQVREQDFISLIVFDTSAKVLIPSRRIRNYLDKND